MCETAHTINNDVWCGATVPPTTVEEIFSRYGNVRVKLFGNLIDGCPLISDSVETAVKLVGIDGQPLNPETVADAAAYVIGYSTPIRVEDDSLNPSA